MKGLTKETQLALLKQLTEKYTDGEIQIAGTQHQEHRERIERSKVGDELLLVRVFGNPYDDNAIDVRNTKDEMIGHFTEEDCAILAPVLEAKQIPVYGQIAFIQQISELPPGADRPVVRVKLYWESKER